MLSGDIPSKSCLQGDCNFAPHSSDVGATRAPKLYVLEGTGLGLLLFLIPRLCMLFV